MTAIVRQLLRRTALFSIAVWAVYGLMLSTSHAACRISGDGSTELIFTGVQLLQEDTCYIASRVIFKSDSLLVMNGFALHIEAAELVAENGARIAALDYPRDLSLSAFPPPKSPDKPMNVVTFDPGPDTSGNPNGPGRNGGKYQGIWQPAIPTKGKSGVDAPPIKIDISGGAQGVLTIVADGGAGQRGADGGRGWTGGDGEQGRRAQAIDSCGLPGGNGGNGVGNSYGGNGGNSGNGGKISISVGRSSDRFDLTYSIAAGVPGAPGRPGDGGRPGVQGCGGRGGPGCGTKAIVLQGLPGRGEVSGLYGYAGQPGSPGAIDLQGVAHAKPLVLKNACAPIEGLDEATKELIDQIQHYDFWALAGRKLFDEEYQIVETADGDTAVVVVPDPKKNTNPLAFISPFKIHNYALKPPAIPSSAPAGCTGESCCVGSVWTGCLASAQWQFASNQNGFKRYADRQNWRKKVIDLLHIEAAKSAIVVPPGAKLPPGRKLYLQYFGGVYLKVEESLFVRLALTMQLLYPHLRDALDSDVPRDRTTLYCTQRNLSRLASPDKTYERNPTTGVIKPRNGVSHLFVVSDKRGVTLNRPIVRSEFMVLPIGFFRSETIIGEMQIADSNEATLWPSRPGFREGGFCTAYSNEDAWTFDRPMSCGGQFDQLIDEVRANWRDLDSPSLITELHSLVFLQAVLATEGFSWSKDNFDLSAEVVADMYKQPDINLHCFSNP